MRLARQTLTANVWCGGKWKPNLFSHFARESQHNGQTWNFRAKWNLWKFIPIPKVRSFIFGAVENIENSSCLIYVDLNKKLFQMEFTLFLRSLFGGSHQERVVKVSRSFNLCTFCLKSLFFQFSSLFTRLQFFVLLFPSRDILPTIRLKGFFSLLLLVRKVFWSWRWKCSTLELKIYPTKG